MTQGNVLPLKLYQEIGLPPKLLKLTSICLTYYGGNPIKVEGKFSLQGQYKEATKALDLYIVQTLAPQVLVLKACTDMGLIKVTRGHGGRVVTLSPPTSEAGVLSP